MDINANIYLSLAATILKGLDCFSHNLTLRDALDSKNELLSSSLTESQDKLENDDWFLDNVGKELITAYIALKRAELEFFKDKTIEDKVEFAYSHS